MSWQVNVAKRVSKQLKRMPAKDAAFVLSALEELADNPYEGDIAKIAGEECAWRRRVGNYRIFYDVHSSQRSVEVHEVRRKTTTTYRR